MGKAGERENVMCLVRSGESGGVHELASSRVEERKLGQPRQWLQLDLL